MQIPFPSILIYLALHIGVRTVYVCALSLPKRWTCFVFDVLCIVGGLVWCFSLTMCMYNIIIRIPKYDVEYDVLECTSIYAHRLLVFQIVYKLEADELCFIEVRVKYGIGCILGKMCFCASHSIRKRYTYRHTQYNGQNLASEVPICIMN